MFVCGNYDNIWLMQKNQEVERQGPTWALSFSRKLHAPLCNNKQLKELIKCLVKRKES